MKKAYVKVPVVHISIDAMLDVSKRESYNIHEMPEELILKPEDPLDLEYLVFHLSSPEVELLVLKYLGYDAAEIMPIIGVPKVYNVYQIGNRLRKNASKIINLS